MADLPDNVLGLRATGKVTGADYESTLIPAVEAKLKDHRKIRLVYNLAEGFENFDAAAMWQDAKVGLGHLTNWERIAVVTDVEWCRKMTKAFGFLMPGHVKVFSNDELGAAVEWASE